MNKEKSISLRYGMGFPYFTYHFCDGRTSVGISQFDGGIRRLVYHGKQPLAHHNFLAKNIINTHLYDSFESAISFKYDKGFSRYEDITIYPFGFTNRYYQGEVLFLYR